MGRKAWLFCGSDAGGRHAALFYSLMVSCKRNQVNPLAYLRDVLSRVATHPASRIRELLPAYWKPPRPPDPPPIPESLRETALQA